MAEKSKYQDIDAVDAALDKGVEASTAIGDSSSGLTKKVADLELKTSGISTSATTDQTKKIVIGENEDDAVVEILQDSVGVKNLNSLNFKGLQAVAFGTSLTERADRDTELGETTTYGYLTNLRTLSGMTIDNQAQGGATILSDNTSKSIYQQITTYSGYATKNVVIIEGFVNDWYKNAENTLGTYTDEGTTTVCGRLRNAIKHILTQNKKITIFVILDHYGRNNTLDFSSTAEWNNGKPYPFYEELAKVCESIGVPVIKEYALSGISELAPQYLADYIHMNELGAKQSANTIWSQMRKYYPKVTNA